MRQRIYISISSLVLLFFINGLMTILTLNSNRHSARHLSKVVNPSLESVIDLRKMLLDSKIYSTNWVFLKLNEDDKTALKKIHNSDYPALKSTLLNEASQWENKNWQDSLNKILVGFENVMAIEKNIMTGLDEFKDYDDSIIKLNAERIIEAEVIPRTTLLMKSLNNIRNHWINIRNEESTLVEQSSMKLRVIIISLAIIIFFIGFLHSLFMARLIIQPINKIRQIVNDLGNGIIRNVKDETKDDEIGKMIRSVNNLSDKMKGTAAFATEIGQRNFNSKFEPFGPDDSLGLALITMRDNLKASDEILNEAQHIARLGSWEADMVNNKLFWSDEIYNIFEIENKKLIPTYEKFLQFIHPQDIAYVKAVVEKCMNDHQPMNYECRVIDSKLNIKYINAQGKITVHEKGVAIKLTGIMQDITQRKTAEAELHKSEKQYRQIVETAQEGIWMVDENNLTTFVNKKMCEILEFSVEEITGRKMDLFMLQKADEIKAGTGANRNEKQSYTYTARFITKSGQVVWGSVSNNPIFDDSKKYMGSLAMVTDITKRKYDEELLLQSQDTLLKNNIELEQKNKELEQFAYVASHDLQEPLRTTISFVELLKNQYAGKLDSNADKYINYIIQASNRMSEFIKDLLDFSRIGHNKELKSIDSNIILQEVMDDIGSAIRESKALITADNLPVFNGYPTEIKQLFQNLILNAIKFRKKEFAPVIKIAAKKTGAYWQFSFADNGIGIDKEFNKRIFIIFQRLHTRTEYEGSGIGLSHCQKIVELHHGKIWVESVPGHGSTFYFTIFINNSL